MYLTNPKLSREEILKSDESCIGGEIPLLAEEGWTRHEENVPLPIWRGRGGQFGEIFRPEHFAKLLLRLRPILRLRAIALALRVGLALRATPSAALRWLRGFLLKPQPPLLCERVTELTRWRLGRIPLLVRRGGRDIKNNDAKPPLREAQAR